MPLAVTLPGYGTAPIFTVVRTPIVPSLGPLNCRSAQAHGAHGTAVVQHFDDIHFPVATPTAVRGQNLATGGLSNLLHRLGEAPRVLGIRGRLREERGDSQQQHWGEAFHQIRAVRNRWRMTHSLAIGHLIRPERRHRSRR